MRWAFILCVEKGWSPGIRILNKQTKRCALQTPGGCGCTFCSHVLYTCGTTTGGSAFSFAFRGNWDFDLEVIKAKCVCTRNCERARNESACTMKSRSWDQKWSPSSAPRLPAHFLHRKTSELDPTIQPDNFMASRCKGVFSLPWNIGLTKLSSAIWLGREKGLHQQMDKTPV